LVGSPPINPLADAASLTVAGADALYPDPLMPIIMHRVHLALTQIVLADRVYLSGGGDPNQN